MLSACNIQELYTSIVQPQRFSAAASSPLWPSRRRRRVLDRADDVRQMRERTTSRVATRERLYDWLNNVNVAQGLQRSNMLLCEWVLPHLSVHRRRKDHRLPRAELPGSEDTR